tara:strand:- start:405914 stop:408346 length:2433 start_codon:yes stop_codon:yes gene_type:complete
MFKNHIKIAWRSLKKQPFFTFINTFGLAIGMAGGLLISLYIYDELSYDKMFADADRIYRVDVDIKFGGEAQNSSEASAPMAAAMKKDFSQIESVTRIRDRGSNLIRKSGTLKNTKELHMAFADSTFFDMFGLELLYGDAKTALTQPNTLVMTKTAAEKHFSLKNALGQNLILNNRDTYTVTGIIDDLPKNSYLRNHSIFMSMSGYPDAQEAEWGSHNYYTFFKLIPNAAIADLKAPIQSMVGNYLLPYVQKYYPGMTEAAFIASGNYVYYNTMPLTDIHLHSKTKFELSPVNTIQNVYILSFIGLFLILLASVNFMNLSTAHSLKRAKEVGVRKTLGSNKADLIKQFLTESGLISFISLLFAIVIAAIAMPYFNELSGKEIAIPFSNLLFWGLLILAVLVLGLLSGSYPAFFMSKFIPVKVLKGGGASSVGGSRIRNSLVVFQFAISVFLIVSTLVVFQQLKFIQSKDLGFAKDQVLVIEDVFEAGDKVHSFKEEVAQLSAISSASLSSYLPTPSSRSNSSFFREGATEQENAINMQTWAVDYDYIQTLNMELVAGRDFSKQFRADSTAIILNESAVKIMGIDSEAALGLRLSRDLGEKNPFFYTVIGVVKNFHFETLRENIGALSFYIGKSSNAMTIKLNVDNLQGTMASVEKLWNNVAPGQPFNYYFMDESFNNSYESERRLGQIFMVFTILSILIACLGLFGLAAFNAEKRIKEVGIRKVMGASVSQISYKLSIDFLKLVIVSIIIALPLGWIAMNRWLEDFTYRVEMGWWVFAAAIILALTIAIVTVSYQAIKAALANPVKSLRTE